MTINEKKRKEMCEAKEGDSQLIQMPFVLAMDRTASQKRSRTVIVDLMRQLNITKQGRSSLNLAGFPATQSSNFSAVDDHKSHVNKGPAETSHTVFMKYCLDGKKNARQINGCHGNALIFFFFFGSLEFFGLEFF